MRPIKDILRLKHQHGLSVREVARSCGLPASTVGDYLQRATAAGLGWPLPTELSEEQLQAKLLGGATVPVTSPTTKAVPNWPHLREELRRKGVTLQLLWQEYRQTEPTGYAYSRFCELYREWAAKLDPVLRQVHGPGEKLFVDWAGQTVPIHDAASGALIAAHVFVAVLGASNKTFVEAFPNEQLASWITGHVHAYNFFGGVTKATVPDNTRTAVVRPCRYEPQLHRTYQELAEHYGTVILPARIKKPRDKAKVETGVQIVERQILAVLRHHRFFSVAALNQAMLPLLTQLNAQPFQKLDGSRDQWFDAQEKSLLRPLPAQPFQLATWSVATVNIDYHVVVDHHYYSVPHSLIHQPLDVRLTDHTVELFQRGKRVAAHVRSSQRGKFTTVAEHRPKAHQRYLQWTPGRLVEWAQKTGPFCAQVVEQILASRPHPEQGFRSCLGIMRLGKATSAERLEAACERALHFGTCTYVSIKSILENHLEKQPREPELALPSPAHPNLRGHHYYH
jgi:transposase